MAASIAKHAARCSHQQISTIDRLLLQTTRTSSVIWNLRTRSYRNPYIPSPLTETALRHDGKSESDRPSANAETSRTADNRHNVERRPQPPFESQGQRVIPRNDKTSDGSDLPRGVSSMRKRLREHHKLGNDSDKYNFDWSKEYSFDSSRHIQQQSNSSEGSKAPSKQDDFFGVMDEIANKINRDNASPHSTPLTKRGKGPVETFKNVLSKELPLHEAETVVELPYGTMRRDQDNIVKSHGRVHAVRRNQQKQHYLKSNQIWPGKNTSQDTQSENNKHFNANRNNYFEEQYFEHTNAHGENRGFNEKQDQGHKEESHHLIDSIKSASHKETHMTTQFTYFEDNLPEQDSRTVNKYTQDDSQSNTHNKVDNIFENQYFDYESRTDTDSQDRGSPPDAISNNRVEGLPEFVQNTLSTPVRSEQNNARNFKDAGEFPNRVSSRRADESLENDRVQRNRHSSVEKAHSQVVPSSNLFDEQYFPEVVTEASIASRENILKEQDSSVNVFDDQYFGHFNENSSHKKISSYPEFEKENDLEHEQYSKLSTEGPNYVKSQIPHKEFDHESTGKYIKVKINSDKSLLSKKKSLDISPNAEPDPENDINVGGYTKHHKRIREKVIPNTENPETAYDLAMKLRREKQGKDGKETETFITPSAQKWAGAVDSKGFRKLKDQVLDIQRVPQDVVVSILRDSILHETDDFIAIDKPYGLPSHGGPAVHHSIGKLAGRLADTMGYKKLELIHRLDKETTGVMLLAKTTEMAWRLRKMFKERDVIKRYWVLTKGVPNPKQGTIDIPMVETEVNGRYRMNVQPYRTEQTQMVIKKQQSDSSRKEAVTKYKVLDSNHGAALVECEPETGVKHQIRCHLAFALNTPIIGDHKYSHYTKMAPQRLPPETLQRLGLRQALVRYVPMHLHAKALVLPQLYDGRNVFISCRLPKHFAQNMAWLKMKPPKGE